MQKFSFTKRDLSRWENDVFFGHYIYELAIPWSPNVTKLDGYNGKALGIDISILGDKLFNTDRYAHIMLVDPNVTTLAVTTDKQSLDEGITDGATFTVTRTGDNSQALELTVTSNDTTELTVPAKVTIPAGKNSITFKGTTVQDYLKDGNQNVTVMVSAQGFTSANVTMTVLDVPPAELAIESLSVSPTSIYPGMSVDVTCKITNNGKLPTQTGLVTKVYLSADNQIGNDTLLEIIDTAKINGNASLTFTETVVIPSDSKGQQWIIVETTYENGQTISKISAPITILSPTLAFISDKRSVDEGLTDAVTFTVTRTGDNSQALELTVSSSDTTELTVPANVTIPAGQNSVTFKGASIQDYVTDGDKKVIITVANEYYQVEPLEIVVQDVSPTKFEISSLLVPGEVFFGDEIDISWIVTNVGQLTNHKNWVENIYFSSDYKIGTDVLFKTTECVEQVAPGASLERLVSVNIPDGIFGNQWVIIETVFNGEVSREIAGPINVRAPELTFTVDKEAAEEGIDHAFTFTVMRNGNLNEPLVLRLHCNKTAELEIPQTVTIPAGESFITFAGNTLHDGIIDANQVVRVTVSATDIESQSVFVIVHNVDQKVEPYIKTLDMETATSQNWTLQQVDNTLKITDERSATVFEESLDLLLGLVLNASNSGSSLLTINLDGGSPFFTQGIVFNGSTQSENIVSIVGTENDDIFIVDDHSGIFNGMKLVWSDLNTFHINGSEGTDRLELSDDTDDVGFHFKNGLGTWTSSVMTNIENTESIRFVTSGNDASAKLYASQDGATFLVDNRSVTMNDHAFDIQLDGFADLEAIALGTASTTVQGGNSSMIVMNERSVERRTQDQFYRVWYSDTVTAIQEPVTAGGFLLHKGSHGEDIVESSELQAQITNTAGSYFHRIFGFTDMSLPKPGDAQPAMLPESLVGDLGNNLEWLYAFLADEQLRTKRQNDNFFDEDDSDNWLAEFEELTLREMRRV